MPEQNDVSSALFGANSGWHGQSQAGVIASLKGSSAGLNAAAP